MLQAFPPPPFWILHIDGSAMPNPGRMAIGAVLTGPAGEYLELGQALPGSGCNNEAELRALQSGLMLARSHGAQAVRIYTDSQWLVEQLHTALQGHIPVRPTLRLQGWLQRVQPLVAAFAQVQWRWIPRRCNTQADALARAASLQAAQNFSDAPEMQAVSAA